MKERAQMWGGEVEIVGMKNAGTTVTIKIKYAEINDQ
jgi:signal transduction histidine kinase